MEQNGQCERQDCKEKHENLIEERDEIQNKYDKLDLDFKELQVKDSELEKTIIKQDGKIETLKEVIKESAVFTESDRDMLNKINRNTEHIVSIMGEQQNTVGKNTILKGNNMLTNIGEEMLKWDAKVTLIGKKEELEEIFSNHWVLRKELAKLESKAVVKRVCVEVSSLQMEEALYMKLDELKKDDINHIAIVLVDGIEPHEDLKGKLAENRIKNTITALKDVMNGLKEKFSSAVFLSAAVGKSKTNKKLFETALIHTFGNEVYSVVNLNGGDMGLENADGSWSPLMSAVTFSSLYNIVASTREVENGLRCLQCGLIHGEKEKCWKDLTFEEDCVVCGKRHEGAGKYCRHNTKNCRFCSKVGHLANVHTLDSSDAFKEKVRRAFGSNFEFSSMARSTNEQGGRGNKKLKSSSSNFSERK